MNELISALNEGAIKLGIDINNEQAEKLNHFANLLLEWNEKINLTAITSPAEIAVKHFLDSVILLKYVDIPSSASLIDVGCGAGFPSVPLLIMRPDLKVTMMDGTEKRLKFIDFCLSELGLCGQTLHMRAEEAGKSANHREKYDFSVARAVAKLNVLSEYCIPLIKNGGSFIAMKGTLSDELTQAKPAIKLLGGCISDEKHYDLLDSGERSIVLIKKISQTPPKYPRASAQIAKKPLI